MSNGWENKTSLESELEPRFKHNTYTVGGYKFLISKTLIKITDPHWTLKFMPCSKKAIFDLLNFVTVYGYLFVDIDKIFYTTFTNFSMKYLVMCKVYTDVGGIK